MEHSSNLDSYVDTTPLPELSFEDFLDESPVKKLSSTVDSLSTISSDNEDDIQNLKDQSLNTPGPKRKSQQRISEEIKTSPATNSTSGSNTTNEASNVIGQSISKEQRKVNILSTPTPPTTPKTSSTISVDKATIINVATATKTSANIMPVLLNSKLAIAKGPGPNQTPAIVKIATTSKPSGTLTPVASSSSTTPQKSRAVGTLTIDGKTAFKTNNGQIVYIQRATPKTPSTASGDSSTAPVASTSGVAMRLKPATTAASATTTVVGNVATTSVVANSSVAGANKTVAIQLIRSIDGKLMPLKTTAATAKNTLTLSPSVAAQLTGKKIVTATGEQIPLKTATVAVAKHSLASSSAAIVSSEPMVTTAKPIKIQKIVTASSGSLTSVTPVVSAAAQLSTKVPVTLIKATTASTSEVVTLSKSQVATTTIKVPVTPISTTATASAVTSTVQSQSQATTTTAGGKIVVQGTTGKPIVVPSSQLIKLSPKICTTTTTAASTSTASTTGNILSGGTVSGQLHAIQIPGKPGVQYVRVVSAAKKAMTSGGSIQPGTVKILNSLPSKVTVVRSSTVGGKIVLTKSPKNDADTSNPNLSAVVASKVQQKTIVSVPSLRAYSTTSDSPNKNTSPIATQVVVNKNAAQPTNSSNNALAVGMPRLKPKISEINSEIQRLTAAGGETKKIVSGQDGKRYFVMPRSMLRSTSGTTVPATSRPIAGQQSQQTQQSQRIIQMPKLYSVYKDETPTTTTAASSEGNMKPFIICKTIQGNGQTVKTIQVRRQLQSTSQDSQQASAQRIQKIEIEPKGTATKVITAQSTNINNNINNSNNNNNNNNNNISNNSNSNNKATPVKIKQEPIEGDDLTSLMFTDEVLRGGVRRKHCNCSKSQCLKLYCDCFANGEFCQDCTCKDCFNNLQYEDERQRAIKTCLERNPSAFKPKITSSTDQDTRLHNKGCNCKRSGCLKNYCECFEAKIPCSSNCKCVGCRNVEDRPDLDMDPIDPKVLESIANASNATDTIARVVSTSNQSNIVSLTGGGIHRTYERSYIKKELKTELDVSEDGETSNAASRKRKQMEDDMISTSTGMLGAPQFGDSADGSQPAEKRSANFITQEVIDATIQCMVSQADECLKNNLPDYQTEKMVLEELGRCLVEIIDFSIRNTDTSFSQN